jgi:hypothetical protein
MYIITKISEGRTVVVNRATIDGQTLDRLTLKNGRVYNANLSFITKRYNIEYYDTDTGKIQDLKGKSALSKFKSENILNFNVCGENFVFLASNPKLWQFLDITNGAVDSDIDLDSVNIYDGIIDGLMYINTEQKYGYFIGANLDVLSTDENHILWKVFETKSDSVGHSYSSKTFHYWYDVMEFYIKIILPYADIIKKYNLQYIYMKGVGHQYKIEVNDKILQFLTKVQILEG